MIQIVAVKTQRGRERGTRERNQERLLRAESGLAAQDGLDPPPPTDAEHLQRPIESLFSIQDLRTGTAPSRQQTKQMHSGGFKRCRHGLAQDLTPVVMTPEPGGIP